MGSTTHITGYPYTRLHIYQATHITGYQYTRLYNLSLKRVDLNNESKFE